MQWSDFSVRSPPPLPLPVLDLSVVFLIGILGSAHCVGMCGGFVALLAYTGPAEHAYQRQAAYFLGKTAMYAAMGALAGLAGGLVGVSLAGMQSALSVVLGLVLVGVGLGLCGVWHRLPSTGALSGRITTRLGPAVRRLVQDGGSSALAGLGALNGLLPCGLVYGMLAKAATTGAPGAGALTLAVFGLGTVPALALAGSVGALIPPTRRLRLQRVGGVLVVGLGLLTIARAAMVSAAVPPVSGVQQILCLP